jgi:diguanylate cyclase (GGDEF)-like protein/PAS domain S-box-containing protein
VIAWTLTYVVYPHVPHLPLAAWILSLTLVLVARYILAQGLTESWDSGHLQAMLLSGVALTGLLWGISGSFLYYTPAELDVVIASTVAIVTVAAMAVLAHYLAAYLAYLFSATLPMIFFVTDNLSPDSVAATGLYLIFLIALTATAIRFNHIVAQSQDLQSETALLNEQLERKNQQLENELEQRRLAQEELTRNKQYLDSVFANAPVEMYLKDRDARYIKINRQFEKIFGVRDEEVRGKLPFDIHDSELARQTHQQDIDVLKSGETRVTEQPCRLPGLDDDSEHTLLTVKFPIKSDQDEVTGLGAVVFDITHQKSVEKELRLSRERFRDFAQIASDFFWEADSDSNLTFASSHGLALNDIPISQLIFSREGVLDSGRVVVDKLWQDSLVLREAHEPYELAASFVHDDEREVRIYIKAKPLTDAYGRFAGYRGVVRDITREHRLQQDFAHQANHDPLTGQYNRRKFLQSVDEFLEDVRQSSRVHLLCYIDLDRFKFVNDSSGHVAGDALLIEVSNVIRRHLRPDDILGRIGGDEFGVLLRNCSTSRGNSIANHIIKGLKEIDFKWEDRRYSISASIGISVIDSGVLGAASLLSDADQACYRAKELGEGCVFVSSRTRGGEAYRTQRFRHTDWLDAFDKCLVELYAQPIVSLSQTEEQRRWFELLIRLVDENGAAHPPEHFIPYAERFGQIARVDQWVVATAFDQIQTVSDWRECRFSINLSGASLHSDKLRRDILERFEHSEIEPRNICFEITETSAIKNLSLARTFIERLRGEGCRLALDDFGTGLASFSYLKHFPVDYVKIDGSFIQDLQNDPHNPVFVRAICAVASAMNMQTVGECVESAEFLEKLADIGVNYAQGVATGEPRPLAQV